MGCVVWVSIDVIWGFCQYRSFRFLGFLFKVYTYIYFLLVVISMWAWFCTVNLFSFFPSSILTKVVDHDDDDMRERIDYAKVRQKRLRKWLWYIYPRNVNKMLTMKIGDPQKQCNSCPLSFACVERSSTQEDERLLFFALV